MITRTYLRPVGRLTRPLSLVDAQPDPMIRIGGRDDLVFAALERIERRADRTVERRLITPCDGDNQIEQSDLAAEQMKAALVAFAAPRRELAGVALDRPRIMGIVNVTPDSFSDGGSFASAREAIDFGRRLVDEGADFLDIGGESTRPGSEAVPLESELRRVMPVIEGLVGAVGARISVDTRKPEVMRRAALAGVHLLNDVSALTVCVSLPQPACRSS
jgi:dihydropteroate synthase